MNIQELDAYNLDDAVKFNDRLNPRLWDSSEHLRPEVREQLLRIAEDFKESLGITDLDLKDITISGSNAAYTYTPNSDIDLHLVVDMPENEVYRELFDAKKFQYNETHDITIGGADVELYVESSDKPPVSQGMYSVLNNKWIQVPRRVKANVDDTSTRNKFLTIGHQIERAIKSGDRKRLDSMARKVKRMRQTGLEAHGEFGPENLAFKILRSQGVLQKLHDARAEAKSRELSLKEKAVKSQKITWGFRTPRVLEDAGMTPDGVSPTTKMFTSETEGPSDEEILKDFIDFCVKELKIDQMPTIKLRRDPQWPVVHRTFGRYINDKHLLEVAWGQRHIMDVLRTVAHELTHKHQHERDGERMGPDAGETGSRWENEANARAGILMRDYGRLHPDYFGKGEAEELHVDEASPIGFVMPDNDPVKAWKNQVRQLILAYRNDPSRLGDLAKEKGPGSAEAIAYAYIRHPSAKIPLPPGASVKESASGYIPTKKQANDPRFKMALTKDIRPGQLGKEANKLKLRTDSQGHPQIANPNGLFEKLSLELANFKRKGTVVESEQLDEVSMRPSSLRQFANSEEAQGIQAGFEAELIFRDTLNDDDGSDEMEYDYDADERCHSIQQVIDFFNGGEYGGLSQRQENRLTDGLDQSYMEWQDEQMYSAWRDEQDEKVRDVWLEERPWEERLHDALTEGMDVSDVDADEIIRLGEDRKNGRGKPGNEYTEEELDMLTKYSEAAGIADDVLEEDVADSIRKEDGYYDQALDNFREDFYVDDDSSFFSDIGLRWMSDVASEYDLEWPYMTGMSNGGSRDWENIADSLNQAVDMPVKVSSGYHNATRKPGLWIVEPDSSLQPDDREDYGLEIVSPPMPLPQALEKLKAVVEWANGDGDAYTNESTGLHMGVSIPYKEGRVDYLKLILFLGDEYVLQQYGREANIYTKAAMRDIKTRAGSEANATRVLELLKHNLIELAERELVKSTGEGKYTSAHKHGKYIEFRSAGGDWLADTELTEARGEPTGLDKLQNTMMRYAYAMYLAGRPDLERKEYAKKLYKLVAGGADDSTMALFSQYAAGELDKDQLKKKWAEKTLSKEAPSEVEKGNWVVVDKSNGRPVQGQEYSGFTREEARTRAKQKLSPGSSDRDFDLRYEVEPQNTGRWLVYRDDHGQEEELEIIDSPTRGAAVDKAYDKYTGVIPFKVRAYYGTDEIKTPPKLSPRAKLAKRIVKPRQQADYSDPDAASDWEAVYTPTGRVVDTLSYADAGQAEAWRLDVIRQHDFTNPDDIVVRRAGQVTDIEPNVAQNFSTNPRPTVQEPNQVRMPNGVPVWEIYDRSNGNVVHTLADHTQREAWSRAQQWLQGIGAEDPSLFSLRPKVLQAGEQNTAGSQTPATSGARAIPSEPGPNGEEPNYEIIFRRYGAPLKRFYAANHPEAMDYLSQYRRTQDGAPSEYAIRNMPVTENFADGKGPGRPGDSQRHGIPKGATIAQLEKAAKAPGRKGQLARWQLNMRRGKAKKNK